MTAGIQRPEQADSPHPEARAFLERLEDRPSREGRPIDEIRREHRERARPDDPPPIARAEDHTVYANGHAIITRIYSDAPDEPEPILVWGHGGGFVLGGVDTEETTARLLARRLSCTVVSVEYRLAPEHPFPAALQDFYAVLEHVTDTFANGRRVLVGGQSAGATLAAASTLLGRARSGPTIDRQLLVVPVLGFDQGREAPEEDTWVNAQYLRHPLDGFNPLAYPLEAHDVSELPPATIVTAGFDENRFDGVAYGERLTEAGIAVSHHHYPDTIHHFLTFAGEADWPNPEAALDAMASDIHD